MKKHDLHFHTQEDTDQAVAFLRAHISPATMTVDQDKISFTDKDKANLRKLLLDLIFSEPREKNDSHP